MLTKFNFNRLGTILLSKNVITREQHKARIQQQNHPQKKLRSVLSHSKLPTYPGEILTESGFIDRAELKYESKVTLVLCKITIAFAMFVMLLGAGSASAGILKLRIPTIIQADGYSKAAGVKNEITTDIGGGSNTGAIHAGDWMMYLHKQVSIPVNGYYLINYRVSSLRGGGSFVFNDIASSTKKIDTVVVPKTNGWQTWVTVQRKVYLKAGPHFFGIQAITGGFNINWFQILAVPVSAKSAASSKSSAKSSSSSSSRKSAAASNSKSISSIDSLYTHIEGPVGLSWLAPKLRVDKTILDITELGGYQLRYKLLTAKTYTYVTINDPWTRTYNFSWLEGDYVFQIAAFDKSGTFSEFAYFID